MGQEPLLKREERVREASAVYVVLAGRRSRRDEHRRRKCESASERHDAENDGPRGTSTLATGGQGARTPWLKWANEGLRSMMGQVQLYDGELVPY